MTKLVDWLFVTEFLQLMIASSWNEFLLENVGAPSRAVSKLLSRDGIIHVEHDACVYLRLLPGRGAVGVDCIPTADGANLRGGEGAAGEAKRSPEAAIGEAAAARKGRI